MPQGQSWAPPSSRELQVNTGTVPVLARSHAPGGAISVEATRSDRAFGACSFRGRIGHQPPATSHQSPIGDRRPAVRCGQRSWRPADALAVKPGEPFAPFTGGTSRGIVEIYRFGHLRTREE